MIECQIITKENDGSSAEWNSKYEIRFFGPNEDAVILSKTEVHYYKL